SPESGIHMGGHAQRDPLVEYQREGYDLFTAMMDAIKEESVGNLYTVQVEVAEDPIVGAAGPNGEWVGPQVNALGGQIQDAVPMPELGGLAQAVEPAAPEPQAVPPAFAPRGLSQPHRPPKLNYSAPSEDASGKAVESSGGAGAADFSKVGRNEPCPCGSGKKFKVCHGDPRKR